ncbi:MAG: hypothetical protein E6Q62_02315 [Nitrosomonas sp.]|nr:MAG: hypothetical protein E6Q62_02315 [Nitrosomonas sp.]
MHPIVPIIMALGAILFFVGLAVQIRLGAKRINTIKLRNKEYKVWQFVILMIGSGIGLIMISVILPKHITYQPESTSQSLSPILSGNLKYELDSVLSSLDLNNPAIINAVARFQTEYQEASQRNDHNTMELLIMEFTHRIRAELQNRDYPESQIEREITRISNILKQSAKQEKND